MKVVLAVAATVLVILLAVPWLQPPLAKLGLNDPSGIGISIVGFLLGLIFWEVHELAPKEASVTDGYIPSRESIYRVLADKAERLRKSEEKHLDVLGATLETAWPLLRLWLDEKQGSNFTVRMCAMTDAPAGVKSLVAPDTFKIAKRNLNEAIQFSESASIVKRDIEIQVYGFDFIPGIHGCRLGNGALFLSLTTWRDGLMDLTTHGYISCHVTTCQAPPMLCETPSIPGLPRLRRNGGARTRRSLRNFTTQETGSA